MSDRMNLKELKTEIAMGRVPYSEIKGDCEDIWHSLESWSGWSTTEDAVYYAQYEHRVVAKIGNTGQQQWYTLRRSEESLELYPYKRFLIRVEIFKGESGNFLAWPYIQETRGDWTGIKHFRQLDGVEFATREAALASAIAEGQRRIDAGFDVDQLE